MKKLIATDMDGTFLKEDHSFDKKRFRHVLDKFREKDYLFVAASGRSLLSLQAVFEDFCDEIAFVAENGSIVSYKGEILFEDKPIEREVYLDLVHQIEAGPYSSSEFVVLSGKNGAYMLADADPAYIEMISQFYLRTHLVADFSDVEEEILKIVATFPIDQLEVAQAWINDTFPDVTAVTTGFNSVDIILSDSNKAVGLEKLCEYLSVTGADVVAFGDNQNDLEMLAFAGLSLATSNARPEVKAVADQVIGHCNDEAVMAYMEEMVDGD